MPITALRILAHTLRDYVGPVVNVSGVCVNYSLNIIAKHFNVIFWHSAGGLLSNILMKVIGVLVTFRHF